MPRIAPEIRDAVEAELRTPREPARSRAAIARAHGIATRTVQRWADELGLSDPWSTADTRAATQAAADRRRAARSQLADELLAVEIPALRARMVGVWRKTLVVPVGMGESDVRQVDEDDAVIARGLKDLHTALGIALDKTLAVDKHDAHPQDDGAGDVLGRLFDGLAVAARVLERDRGDDAAEQADTDEDVP